MVSSSVGSLYERGVQLQQTGQLVEALSFYQRAVEVEPACFEALHGMAEVFYAQGRLSEAKGYCQEVIKFAPAFAPAYKTLGNVFQAEAKLDAALRAYALAVEVSPGFAEAEANLGTVLFKLGRLDEAIGAYRRAVALKPSLAGVYWNLGRLLAQTGQEQEAQVCWQQAVDLQPELAGPDFLFHKANEWAGQGDWPSAQRFYQLALKLKPNWPEALSNLGAVMVMRGKVEGELNNHDFMEAFNTFLKALQLDSDLMFAHDGLYWLVMVLVGQNRDWNLIPILCKKYFAACTEDRRAIAEALHLNTNLNAGLSEVVKKYFDRLQTNISERLAGLKFEEVDIWYQSLIFTGITLRDDVNSNTELAKLIAGRYREFMPVKVDKKRGYNKKNRLKIGFISNHFRRHSVGWCCRDVVRELAKNAEVNLYASEPIYSDILNREFQLVSHKYYASQRNNLQSSSGFDQKLYEEMIADELDVLVDLDSMTVKGFADIMYQQPAPLCLSWLGFEPPFISEDNYFLCDGYTHPAGMEKYYTEKLVRMPAVWVAVAGFSSTTMTRDLVRKSLRIAPEEVVFLCVATARKLNRETMVAQVQILQGVEGSILVYKGVGNLEAVRQGYQQVCQQLGVSLHRLKFVEVKQTEEEHRDIYKAADVVLDSFPYNGGTHNLEALWFEVPVVSRFGEGGMSRMGLSLLKNLGVEEGISQSWDDYIQWGIKLGKDANLRSLVKQKLQDAKQPDSLSPVWNPQKFAQDMLVIFQELLDKKITD